MQIDFAAMQVCIKALQAPIAINQASTKLMQTRISEVPKNFLLSSLAWPAGPRQ